VDKAKQNSVTEQGESATLTPEQRRRAPISEEERELKMAERSALLMQVAAINKYLGITPRCKNCGADIKT
jgi:hypothetical protein